MPSHRHRGGGRARARWAAPAAGLAEKVHFLSDVAAYEGAARSVEAVETHMSWVFLADKLVYKLKKPVRYPYLDFGTIGKRRQACLDELRLNRRLAAGVYRAVVPLCRDDAGRLAIGGPGHIVDWLVEMTRLVARDMLDARIVAGSLAPADVRRLAERLAVFYRQCRPQIDSGRDYIRHLRDEHITNRCVLEGCHPDIVAVARPLLDRFERAFPDCERSIEARIGSGFIVEGHGDLRPEHVCLDDTPLIIDCLEFSRSMRILDPYDEVAYLGLECEVLGAGWVRPHLLGVLCERIGHPPCAGLLAFYALFRCLLRARLSMAHLLEPGVRMPQKWKPLALTYLSIAGRESVNLPFPAAPRSSRCRPEV